MDRIHPFQLIYAFGSMTLRLTSAPVSGVKKRKSAASRPRASPFAGHARRKPATGGPSGVKPSSAPDPSLDEQLRDVGGSHYIADTAPVQNVAQAIQYIRTNMFDEMPTRAGMNSTRIAEVLNLRRSLPPLASVAHVHTLLDAPTQVEKEIVELVQKGRVRRLIIPGRGGDAAGLGDCLVLSEDWDELVRGSSALDTALKGECCGAKRLGGSGINTAQRNSLISSVASGPVQLFHRACLRRTNTEP